MHPGVGAIKHATPSLASLKALAFDVEESALVVGKELHYRTRRKYKTFLRRLFFISRGVATSPGVT